MKFPRNEKLTRGIRGFTLIELLIVIVIVGILVSIVGGSSISARRKAWDAQRKADMHELQSSLEIYFSDNSKYPEQDSWQDTLIEGKYLKSAIDAPGKTNEYTYNPSGAPPNAYILSIQLENSKDTGSKIDANGVFTLTQKQ